MDECITCDTLRGILCIDCYRRVDDNRLPTTYREYVAWAAAYPSAHKRQSGVGLVLAAAVALACLLGAAAASDTGQRVGRDVAVLRAKTEAVSTYFDRLREAKACAEAAFGADLREAVERAARGEQPAIDCEAFARR